MTVATPPKTRIDPAKDAAALLRTARFSQLPIDVEGLALRAGAELKFQHFEGDISGVVIRQPPAKPIIGVNSFHPKTRQRFTIAHELGHLRLHEGEPLIVDKLVVFNVNLRSAKVPSDVFERAANTFAATLLMPTELLMREVKRCLPKRETVPFDKLIAELCRIFDVSEQAMSIRLREVGVLSPLGVS